MRALPLIIILALSLVTIPAVMSAEDTDADDEVTYQVNFFAKGYASSATAYAYNDYIVAVPDVDGVVFWSTDANVLYSTGVTHVYSDTIWDPSQPVTADINVHGVTDPYVIETRETEDEEESNLAYYALGGAVCAVALGVAVLYMRRH